MFCNRSIDYIMCSTHTCHSPNTDAYICCMSEHELGAHIFLSDNYHPKSQVEPWRAKDQDKVGIYV